MASGGPSMYHPWPSMEFAMTTYKLDPLVARPGPSRAMDGMPWSLSTGRKFLSYDRGTIDVSCSDRTTKRMIEFAYSVRKARQQFT